MGETSIPAWAVEKYGNAGVNPVVQGPGESRVNTVMEKIARNAENRRQYWSEAELGRADEPPSDRDWIGPVYASGDYVPLVCIPTAELVGNTGTTLGEFFFWGQNVEDDDSPDYLAITRDVVGG